MNFDHDGPAYMFRTDALSERRSPALVFPSGARGRGCGQAPGLLRQWLGSRRSLHLEGAAQQPLRSQFRSTLSAWGCLHAGRGRGVGSPGRRTSGPQKRTELATGPKTSTQQL